MIIIQWYHEVFDETATAIADMLYITLGESLNVKFNRYIPIPNDPIDSDDSSTYIIMGIHRLKTKLPKRYIAIQSEQLGSRWFTELYFDNLRGAISVWDFSPKNVIHFKKEHNFTNIVYVPTRVPLGIFLTPLQNIHQDVDVLFFGAMHPRRKKIQEYITRRFIKNSIIFRYNNLFGEERENLIKRSKIVLNIHYWEKSSLETHRIEYLSSNGKCIISEKSSDPMLDDVYCDSVTFVTPGNMEELASKIKILLTNKNKRENMEKKSRLNCMNRQFQLYL